MFADGMNSRVTIEVRPGGSTGRMGGVRPDWQAVAEGVPCRISSRLKDWMRQVEGFERLNSRLVRAVQFATPVSLTGLHRLKLSDPQTGAVRYLMVHACQNVHEMNDHWIALCEEQPT